MAFSWRVNSCKYYQPVAAAISAAFSSLLMQVGCIMPAAKVVLLLCTLAAVLPPWVIGTRQMPTALMLLSKDTAPCKNGLPAPAYPTNR